MPTTNDKNNRSITRAAGTVGSMTLLSRFFGFIRDMVIAMMFGSTAAADAFFVAFRIPNIQRRLLGEGAISSAFIPVFSEYHSTKSEEDTWVLAANLFNILFIILAASCLALFFLAPWVVMAFAPGFIEQPDKYELTVSLTRWMAPFVMFVGVAAFCMGVLNTFKMFALSAASPVLLNISMITSALFLSPKMEEPVMGLAVGVVIGGMLQFFLQLPAIHKLGFKFRPTLNWRHPGVVKIGKLIAPAVIGLAAYEVNLLVDTLLASLLPGGSISYLYYANRLVQLPLGVFGVALGIAILPLLSQQASEKKTGELRETIAFGIRLVLFITVPATVGLILLRYPIVNTLWERGLFTSETTQGTAVALLYYSIGLCAFSGSKILISAFYSLQDTRTPMVVGVWSMLLNVVLNLVLMGPLQHGGLALATSLAALFNALMLLYILKKRLGRIGGALILSTTLKVFLAAGLMGILVYLFNVQFFDTTAHLMVKLLTLIAAISLGAFSFGWISHLMKIEELKDALNLRGRSPSPQAPLDHD